MTFSKERIEAVLKIFVGDDPIRPLLHSPIKQKDYLFATNAHALIGIKNCMDLGYVEIDKTPNCLGVIPTERHEPIVFDISKIEKQILTLTPMVDETVTCIDCSGEGKEECNLGHDHECERCDGKGFVKKHPPNKVTNPEAKYTLYETTYTADNLKRLIRACQFLDIKKINKVYGMPNRASLFEYENILILIMPDGIWRDDDDDEPIILKN